MRNASFRLILLAVIVAFSFSSKAQLTQGIAINTIGNANYTGAILDLSNQNTIGTSGFLPPYVLLTSATTLSPVTGTSGQLSGLLVYNTSTSTASGLSGPGLYYWNSSLSTWIFLGSGAGSLTAANNGLSLSGTTIQLGGSLITTTKIPLNGDTLFIKGSSDTTTFIPQGQVGIGNTKPNAKAILDLTNATDFGLMLPGITTSNLPPITSAQNGLVVFNSSLGSVEYAYNGNWNTLPAQEQEQSFSYTGNSIQSWVVPSGVTSINIVASGGAGGYSDLEGDNSCGATVLAVGVSVVPTHTLEIVVGEEGGNLQTYAAWSGGGGGGGTFVWDNASTTYPLVAAGGGGGGSGTTNVIGVAGDAEAIGYPGSTTTAANGNTTYNGAEGSSGGSGSAGTGYGGGGGAGWNTGTGTVPPNTTAGNKIGSGGSGYLGATPFDSGVGAVDGGGVGGGGYGGGGGGGSIGTTTRFGGGGGGGGYNGGGGGNGGTTDNTEYGGAGGGSGYYNGSYPYTNSSDFVNPTFVIQANTGNGSVIIYWQ